MKSPELEGCRSARVMWGKGKVGVGGTAAGTLREGKVCGGGGKFFCVVEEG